MRRTQPPSASQPARWALLLGALLATLTAAPARLAGPIREALVMHNAEGVFAIRSGPWKLVAAGAAPGARENSPWAKGRRR